MKDLEHRVDKLNEEKIIDSAVVEENMNMKNQLNVNLMKYTISRTIFNTEYVVYKLLRFIFLQLIFTLN